VPKFFVSSTGGLCQLSVIPRAYIDPF
jgi:hypothetical protein